MIFVVKMVTEKQSESETVCESSKTAIEINLNSQKSTLQSFCTFDLSFIFFDKMQ